MKQLFAILLAGFFFMAMETSHAQASSGSEPLRVGIAGLVHGHVAGFFERDLAGGET